jgi:hypothetical protein
MTYTYLVRPAFAFNDQHVYYCLFYHSSIKSVGADALRTRYYVLISLPHRRQATNPSARNSVAYQRPGNSHPSRH